MPPKKLVYKLSPSECSILQKVKEEYIASKFAKDQTSMSDIVSSATELIFTEADISDETVQERIAVVCSYPAASICQTISYSTMIFRASENGLTRKLKSPAERTSCSSQLSNSALTSFVRRTMKLSLSQCCRRSLERILFPTIIGSTYFAPRSLTYGTRL